MTPWGRRIGRGPRGSLPLSTVGGCVPDDVAGASARPITPRVAQEALNQVAHLVHVKRLGPDVYAGDLLEVMCSLLQLPDVAGAQDHRDAQKVTVGPGQHNELPARNLLPGVLQPQIHDEQVGTRAHHLLDGGVDRQQASHLVAEAGDDLPQ